MMNSQQAFQLFCMLNFKYFFWVLYSSNTQNWDLFNLKASRCSAYWKAALKSRKSYSYEI